MRRSSTMTNALAGLLVAALAGALLASLEGIAGAQGTRLTWKGHTWRVTSGAMVGVCQGNPSNVSVDASGYLHLRITNAGGVWTAAELFTTDRLGFGTYQWQVDAPIDRFDPNVVLGLFPYGPTAARTNEIDIEYAFWGRPNGPNADWVVYPASGTTVGSFAYRFSLNGSTFSTSRFTWRTNSVSSFLIGGFEPVTSTAPLINSWTYTPANPTVNIPQTTLPLGMNLWCFNAPPANGQNVEAIIRDFQFVPEGTIVDGGAPGAGGAGGTGGAPGGAGGAGTGVGGTGTGTATGTGTGTATATGTGTATGAGGTGAGAGAGGAGAGGAGGTGGGAAGTDGVAGGATGTSGGTGTGGTAGRSVVPPGIAGGTNQGGCACELARKHDAPREHLLWLAAPLLVLVRRARRSSARRRQDRREGVLP